MSEIEKLIRPNILKMVPYSSARSLYKGKDYLLMDANENPYGIYNRYPDPVQENLKETLAQIKQVSPENIFLGNGSDEIIDLLIRIFCMPGKDAILTFTPTYGMYKVCAALNDVEVIELPLTQNFQIPVNEASVLFDLTRIKICFICSPNNPTGNLMKEKDVRFILRSFKGIVVIDEAYIDFTNKKSMIKFLSQFPRLLVMQTLSKAYGMAGLRIGLGFNEGCIINVLNKVKPPYNISTANQKQALNLLQNYNQRKAIDNLIEERKRLERALMNFNTIESIFPSASNFLLCKVTDAEEMYSYFLNNGIILRNRSKDIPNTIRISIGKPEENNNLIDTLKQYDERKSTIPG